MSTAKLEVSGGSQYQQQGPDRSSQEHLYIFLSSLCSWDQQHLDGELPNCPRAQGRVSPQGVQDNVQEDARFKVNTAGEARKAELVPKGSSACSRSDGITGVPSLGALCHLQPNASSCPRSGSPLSVTSCPKDRKSVV